jgi:hypothetical protein
LSAYSLLARRRIEFEQHVWNHAIDPFQAAFDERRPLTDAEKDALETIRRAVCGGASDDDISERTRELLARDERLIETLLQLTGLTRNKILVDLKAAPGSRRIPSSHLKLSKDDEVWSLAGPYLAAKLRLVLAPLCQGDTASSRQFLESLNQATWPGWIRQERAKRQGHEAEGRLATILYAGDIPFEPHGKVDNPLCPDVTLHGVSFDLVIGSVEVPLVCIKSTVHTANIGQYGESKDALEVREAREMIDSEYKEDARPMLMTLVDGVGFFSNRAGLDAVLTTADEFCQFRTLWKPVVLAGEMMGRVLTVAIDPDELERHPDYEGRGTPWVKFEALSADHRALLGSDNVIEAGEAIIVF